MLSLPAKLAVMLHDLFPGLTTNALAFVNRLLPKAGGVGEEWVQGKDSESLLAPSWLTALTDKAAAENNEIEPGEWHPKKRFTF